MDNIEPPKIIKNQGSLHPINQTKNFLIELLSRKGFQEVSGPEIETEEYNFDMLNIKESHPARQMHDTFYLESKKYVMRTHTSPVQIRSMLGSKPPIAYCSAGKVYRKDDDATHLPMFHQIEGIYVDKGVTFANLKDLMFETIILFLNFVLGKRSALLWFFFSKKLMVVINLN